MGVEPRKPTPAGLGGQCWQTAPSAGDPDPKHLALHWALQASWEALWGVSLRSSFPPPMACMPGETGACSAGHLTSHNDRKSWPKWLMGSEVGEGYASKKVMAADKPPALPT